jgi:hypothetical protein
MRYLGIIEPGGSIRDEPGRRLAKSNLSLTCSAILRQKQPLQGQRQPLQGMSATMRKTFGAKQITRVAMTWPALAVVGVLCHCPGAWAAVTLDRPEAVVGQWNMALDGANKQCRVTLRSVPVHGGLSLAMPIGCRHALPILNSVGAWILPGDNHLGLADVYGKSVVDFSIAMDGALVASGPQGETYRLTRVAEAMPAKNADAVDQTAAAPIKLAANSPHAVIRPSEVAGRYSVMREGGKDTGCMLTLDDQVKTKGGDKAFLSPACRDQGIVIFDPAAWQLVSGRLVLTARKGHTTHLDLQPDGVWLKDPKEGNSLSLKKF